MLFRSVQLSHSRRSCGRSSAGSSRRCGGRRTAACGQGSCSSCSSGNFQKITTSNHSFVPSLFAYYNVQRPARHSSVLRAFDGCMKKAPVLDLEPTLRQGREHNILPWYHLGLPYPCGHSLNAAAALLLTAGRCNGRSRCRLSTHAPRPHSSETIFSFLFPALFHRPGFLVRINAKAYSSLHSHFCDIAFIIIQSTGFVNTYNEVF